MSGRFFTANRTPGPPAPRPGQHAWSCPMGAPRRPEDPSPPHLDGGGRVWLAESVCSKVTTLNTCMKHKFSLPKTSRAPRIQEYNFSMSAGCPTTLLNPIQFPLSSSKTIFYQVFPTPWLNWVCGRPSQCIREKKPTPLHLDSWFFTARDLEYVR